jgi:hypothetical protein
VGDLKTTAEERGRFREWLHDDTRDNLSIRAWRVAEDACHDVDTLLAENAKLRAVAEAARAAVPRCQETRFDDASEHSYECGEFATHVDRMNGRDTSFLCAEHAEASLRIATKAASKGYTRAVELDAPRPLSSDQRIDDLRAALAALGEP